MVKQTVNNFLIVLFIGSCLVGFVNGHNGHEKKERPTAIINPGPEWSVKHGAGFSPIMNPHEYSKLVLEHNRVFKEGFSHPKALTGSGFLSDFSKKEKKDRKFAFSYVVPYGRRSFIARHSS